MHLIELCCKGGFQKGPKLAGKEFVANSAENRKGGTLGSHSSLEPLYVLFIKQKKYRCKIYEYSNNMFNQMLNTITNKRIIITLHCNELLYRYVSEENQQERVWMGEKIIIFASRTCYQP